MLALKECSNILSFYFNFWVYCYLNSFFLFIFFFLLSTNNSGTGLMGTVRIAKWKENNGYFALKAIRRDYINKHHDQRHVASERNILRSMSSSFCIRLFGAFEDTTNLYFATELAVGGELMRRLSKKRSFGPQTAKFYTCK